MTRTANWSPYIGSGSTILAVVLLIIAGLLIFLAVRLPHPIAVKRPGWSVGALIVLIWVLSTATFLVALTAYGKALVQQEGHVTGPTNPITPVTFTSGLLAFVAISALTRQSGFRVAVGSAIVGSIAAPMIFEFPCDLIVMGRTYPPSPAALYTPLFFFPLFLIEISSFAMLMLSPLVTLSRTPLFLLAGMFLVFAVWALFGFAYPSAPLPTALNMLAKVLAFAAAVSLFLPEGDLGRIIRLVEESAPASGQTPHASGLT